MSAYPKLWTSPWITEYSMSASLYEPDIEYSIILGDIRYLGLALVHKTLSCSSCSARWQEVRRTFQVRRRRYRHGIGSWYLVSVSPSEVILPKIHVRDEDRGFARLSFLHTFILLCRIYHVFWHVFIMLWQLVTDAPHTSVYCFPPSCVNDTLSHSFSVRNGVTCVECVCRAWWCW